MRTLKNGLKKISIGRKTVKSLLTQLDGLQEGSMEEQHLYQDLIDKNYDTSHPSTAVVRGG